MEFERSVLELIKTRRSTRTYVDKEIESIMLHHMEEYLHQVNREATIKVRFVLTSSQTKEQPERRKLGTYGVVTGANTFIAGILDKEEKKITDFGYLFEKIILKATDLGLQTCWLGGTFKKSDFEKSMDLAENEQIVMVSPLGYKKEKMRMLETAMRKFAGSDNRKPWNELFFDRESTIPLTKENAGLFSTPLEMVRLAPSASNKQPWRVMKEGDLFHFFLCRTKGYWATAFDMQKNDIGIAMCHFELSVEELKLWGKWQPEEVKNTPKDWEYITTWQGK